MSDAARLALACAASAAAGGALAWSLAQARPAASAEASTSVAERPALRCAVPATCSCAGAAGPFTPRWGAAPAKADPFDPKPRSTFLSWDDYFMAIAFLSSQRSKDPKKQVGACIVNAERVIVGIGYNGFPRGCADDCLPWAKSSADGDILKTKVPYVVHAEANAILNTNASTLRGAHLYVTMYPCCECAKLIIQCGIRDVTYYEGKSIAPGANGTPVDPLYVAAAKMLALAGVRVQQHRSSVPLVLNLFGGAPRGAEPVAVLSSP